MEEAYKVLKIIFLSLILIYLIGLMLDYGLLFKLFSEKTNEKVVDILIKILHLK